MTGSDRVFFFSSRRRHTRYWRDWSSDVCSSDLPHATTSAARAAAAIDQWASAQQRNPTSGRSEERRVGKECRCRWPPYHEKKEQGGARREAGLVGRGWRAAKTPADPAGP